MHLRPARLDFGPGKPAPAGALPPRGSSQIGFSSGSSASALAPALRLRLELGHQLWHGLRLRRQPRLRPDSTPASAYLRRQLGFDQSCGLGSCIGFTSARPAAGGRPRSNRAKPPSAHGAPSAGSSCMFYECRYEVKHNLAKTATHGEGTARPLLRPSNRPTTARAAPIYSKDAAHTLL